MIDMKNEKKLFSLTFVSAFMILMLMNIAGAAQYAYIANPDNSTVSVFDTENNTVVATVDAGSLPVGIAVTLDGTKVYVANQDDDTISVIDTGSNCVIATVNVGSKPWGVAINPEGTKVYVTNQASNTVSVIEAVNNTVVATVPVGNWPLGIAVNPAGTKVFVVSRDGLSVIDQATNTVTDLLSLEGFGAAVSPDGSKVYVTSSSGDTLFVVDTETNNITATVSVEMNSSGISVNPEDPGIYIARMDSVNKTISLIDAKTDMAIATLSLGTGIQPDESASNPEGTKVYVVNWAGNNVSVIDAATSQVIATVDVGFSPSAFWQFIVPLPGQPVLPAANFSSNCTCGYEPLSVQFTDLSENATEWSWSFGDGTNSTEQSPEHTYYAAGNYTVNLTVANGNGTDSKLTTITVLEPDLPVLPEADFSSDITAGNVPLSVQFTDASTGAPTEWYWDFGDGEYSGLQNPVHTYYAAGNYTVTLEVSNAEGGSNITKPDYIQVEAASSIKLTSITLDGENSTGTTTNSGASTTNLADPLTQVCVKDEKGVLLNQPFDRGSLGEISIPLKPGINNFTLLADGIFSENEYYGAVLFFDDVRTPPQIAVYNSNGGTGNFSVQTEGTDIIGSANGGLFFDKAPGKSTYTAPDGTKVEVVDFAVDSTNGTTDEVSWGDTGSNGNPDTEAELSLRVTLPVTLPVADFSASPVSGEAPLKVMFTDVSTGMQTERYWDFGDGSNDSVNINPEHTYTVPGTYNASLTVSNENGTSSKYTTITVLEQTMLPAVNVTSNVTSGYAPLSVEIISLLQNATGVSWDFGDGNNSLANLILEHLYTVPGTYNFTVTAANENGTNSEHVQITVLKPPVLPVADFSSDTREGLAPLTVQFTDSLENETDRYWDFGDGTNSTEQNPVHTYSKPGKYTVTLTAKNIIGANTVAKYDYIYVINTLESPVTAFTASPTSGTAPLNVSFTDSSTGSSTSWKWNFGDGNTSTEQNPVHTYTKAGQYTVSLTTSNAMGSNALTKYSYIKVADALKAPVTAFSAFPTSGTAPLNVSFTDNSTESPTSWKWSFGDGKTSTEQNPVHTYTSAGKYNVTLTAKNAAGSNAVTKSGYITVSKKK